MKVWRFTDVVYDTAILLVVGTPLERFRVIRRYVDERFAGDDEEPVPARGCVYTFDHGCVVIWFKAGLTLPKDLAVVVHECAHASFDVLRLSSVKFDPDNQEPYAYHLEWLFKEVSRRLRGRR